MSFLLRKNRTALLLVSSLGFALALAGQSSNVTEAPTGFTTPTLNQNPGSQSTGNGFTEPAGDTFTNDQSHFEEQDGVDNGLGPIIIHGYGAIPKPCRRWR